jgi:hypothetical protein
MLSPIVLPLGTAGFVVVAALGAIVTGVGLGLISPRTDTVAAHRSLDSLLVLLSAIASLVLAFAGEATAALVLALLVAVQVSLSFTTRYATARPASAAGHTANVSDGGFDPLGDPLAGETDFLVQELRRAMSHVPVGQPDPQDSGRDARV